jgi:hypothetical protein
VKFFDLRGLASSQGGEYVLGAKDLHSDTCYLVYGILRAGEAKRLVRAGVGHEEILCAVDGSLALESVRGTDLLPLGHAVHVGESDSFFISNTSDRPVVYVLAGARIQTGGRDLNKP